MPIQPRARVLCVDNDKDSREMLSALLKFYRLETETVATAAQALSLIQAERFDLYSKPDVDGLLGRISQLVSHADYAVA